MRIVALFTKSGVLFAAVASTIVAQPRPGDVTVNPKDGERYVWIAPGSFTMGCSPGDTECNDNEKPARNVTITKGFWMAQTPVTIAAYKRYAQETQTVIPPNRDSRGRKQNAEAESEKMPVVGVLWEEATKFCGWAGARLPSEAEWEFAARAGTEAPRYGNLDDIAWYGDNSGKHPIDSIALWRAPRTAGDLLFENGNGPKPVGQKKPNAWNLYDMLGNVWQWTAGQFGKNVKSEVPAFTSVADRQYTRGGSWSREPMLVRVSVRLPGPPAVRNSLTGFRCVSD